MIGDFLYALSGKEAQTAPVLQRVIQRGSTSLAAATVTVNLSPVPLEMIFHLTHLNVRCISGAAQTCTTFRVEIEDELGNIIAELWRSVPDAAPVADRADARAFNVLLMPRERLTLDGFFNAGAAANIAGIDAIGMFLPRGNIQFR